MFGMPIVFTVIVDTTSDTGYFTLEFDDQSVNMNSSSALGGGTNTQYSATVQLPYNVTNATVSYYSATSTSISSAATTPTTTSTSISPPATTTITTATTSTSSEDDDKATPASATTTTDHPETDTTVACVCTNVLVDGQPWSDAYGLNCGHIEADVALYESTFYVCELWSYEGEGSSHDGYTMLTACCVCGGGVQHCGDHSTSTTITSSSTSSTASTTSTTTSSTNTISTTPNNNDDGSGDSSTEQYNTTSTSTSTSSMTTTTGDLPTGSSTITTSTSGHVTSSPPPECGIYRWIYRGSTAATYVHADQAPPDDSSVDGWSFIKTADSAADAKINWYAYAKDSSEDGPMLLSNLDYFWAIVTINLQYTSALPWLMVHTSPQGLGYDHHDVSCSGDGGVTYWCRNKLLLQIADPAPLNTGSGRLCMYYGTNACPPGLTPINLTASVTGPGTIDTDTVEYLSIHTDSAATNVNLTVESLAWKFSAMSGPVRLILKPTVRHALCTAIECGEESCMCDNGQSGDDCTPTSSTTTTSRTMPSVLLNGPDVSGDGSGTDDDSLTGGSGTDDDDDLTVLASTVHGE